MSLETRQIYEFGPFVADPQVRALMRDGEIIPIPPKGFDVLLALLRSGRAPLSRDELMTIVWGDELVEEGNLTNAIWVLRKALGDETSRTRYIETIPRRGYRFGAPVRERASSAGQEIEIEESQAEKLVIEQASTEVAPVRWPTRRDGLLVCVLFTALLTGGIWLWRTLVSREPARNAIGRISPASPFPEYTRLTSFPDSVHSPALSKDGKMLAFIRGPVTFLGGPGEIYLKVLPDGQPTPLTHDGTVKIAPVFPPDGSRVVYTATRWSSFSVPVSGGQPALFMANAAALSWIGSGQVLFSEMKRAPNMGVVTASESRSQPRDVYVPSSPQGMAHFSEVSPDGKWVLIVEMDMNAWLPCRVVPFDASSIGKKVGPPGVECTSATWSRYGRWMYFAAALNGESHLWRQAFPEGLPEQITSGLNQERGVTEDPVDGSLITSVGNAQSTVCITTRMGTGPYPSKVMLIGHGFLLAGRRCSISSGRRRSVRFGLESSGPWISFRAGMSGCCLVF